MKKFTLFSLTILFLLVAGNTTKLLGGNIYNERIGETQITIPQNINLNLANVSYQGFEPNFGQVGDYEGKKVNDVLIYWRGKDFSLYIRKSGVTFVVNQKSLLEFDKLNLFEFKNTNKNTNVKSCYARIDLDLLNANIDKEKIIYENELPGYNNYYLPQYPEGIFGIKNYRIVKIQDIYPGVDWIFRVDETGKLHHEFEVKPGTDISNLKFNVKWADIEIKEEGKQLLLSTPIGKISDGIIESHSGNKKVDVKYKLDGKILSYEVIGWDGVDKLIIDPPLSLLWATYYGGNNYENTSYNSITSDNNGNIFICGYSQSSNFPTQDAGGGAYYQGTYGGGLYDVVILKFNNNGVRQWATYYGGGQTDYGYAISTDLNNNIFVTGATNSSNFPLYNPGGGVFFQGTKSSSYDVFILKFANNGVRLWATYYGGNGLEEAYSIKTDGSGNLFLCGHTSSTDFPTMPGSNTYFQEYSAGMQDLFIMKFSNNGIRNWATYYGGGDNDFAYSLTIDEVNNLYICGSTYSNNFPVKDTGGAFFQGNNNGSVDAFILKFDANNCTRKWATYYGGSSQDEAFSLTADSDENLYVCGYTNSTNFSTINPYGGAYFQGSSGGDQDVFILKFSYYGIRIWATYYGGSSAEKGYNIKADVNNNIYVCGYTYSSNFPVKNPGSGAFYQSNNSGNEDCFFIRFNNNSVRQWATYYGSSNGDYATSLTTDASGNLFITGYSNSSGLLTYNPGGGAYYQNNNAGSNDIIILKFQAGTIDIKQIGSEVPSNYELEQNYPNPFNSSTCIKFQIPQAEDVKLIVYDLLGREVETVVNERLEAGVYQINFDATSLSSGVYLYRLFTNKYSETKQMILIK